MNTAAVNPTPGPDPVAAARPRRAATSVSFAQKLQAAQGPRDAQDATLREAIGQFVGMAFIAPLMDMMRNDPFRSEMFHGGMGEKVFGPQLDEHLTDQIATSPNFPLVETLYEQMTRHRGAEVDLHG